MSAILTQEEVAAELRKSVETVKRLRLSGVLPFLPGRPVTVRSDDLQRYIDEEVKRCRAKIVARISQTNRMNMVSGKSVGPKIDEAAAARRVRRMKARLKKY